MATHVHEQRGLVERGPLLLVEPGELAEAQGDAALPEHVLHRLAETEVDAERQRAEELGHPSTSSRSRWSTATPTYFITFLQAVPGADAAAQLEALTNDYDPLLVRERDVHWLMHGLSSDSPLKSRQWMVVGEFSTSRNTTMLHKLTAKIDAR